MRNYFEKSDNMSLKAFDASQCGMKFILISFRRVKQMRKIMHNRALFILHKKRETLKF